MIKALRIDDRLMHAQVTFGWANSLNAKGILIISDRVANDPTMKMAAQFARPEAIKLWIRTVKEGIEALPKLHSFGYNTLILADNVADALQVCKACSFVKYVNMGGQRMAEGRNPILGTVYLSQQDLNDLKSIQDLGVEVEVKKMITDPGYPLKNFL